MNLVYLIALVVHADPDFCRLARTADELAQCHSNPIMQQNLAARDAAEKAAQKNKTAKAQKEATPTPTKNIPPISPNVAKVKTPPAAECALNIEEVNKSLKITAALKALTGSEGLQRGDTYSWEPETDDSRVTSLISCCQQTERVAPNSLFRVTLENSGTFTTFVYGRREPIEKVCSDGQNIVFTYGVTRRNYLPAVGQVVDLGRYTLETKLSPGDGSIFRMSSTLKHPDGSTYPYTTGGDAGMALGKMTFANFNNYGPTPTATPDFAEAKK